MVSDIQVNVAQGQILLHLPEEQKYDIYAKSDFGSVNSDFSELERRNRLLGHRSDLHTEIPRAGDYSSETGRPVSNHGPMCGSGFSQRHSYRGSDDGDPRCDRSISGLARTSPELIVGGTANGIETARRCLDAGAEFLTSPGSICRSSNSR